MRMNCPPSYPGRLTIYYSDEELAARDYLTPPIRLLEFVCFIEMLLLLKREGTLLTYKSSQSN